MDGNSIGVDNMVVTPGSLIPDISPAVIQLLDVAWQYLQLFGVLAIFAFVAMMYRFDTRVNIREYARGGRVIARSTRARKIKDKKTGAPKLQFFGTFGFRGEIINEPPAACLVPFRSRVTNKMYDFVKKDGLYYPVENFVLGTRYFLKEGEKLKAKLGEIDAWAKIKGYSISKVGPKESEVYSIQGSGLETTRDFDAEQAIQNTLIEKATVYRNRKPTEIIASFALMIITIITAGIIMWYALRQFGNLSGAIASLNEPLKQGIIGAAQGILGPG